MDGGDALLGGVPQGRFDRPPRLDGSGSGITAVDWVHGRVFQDAGRLAGSGVLDDFAARWDGRRRGDPGELQA